MCLFSHSDPKSPDEEFHLSHPIHSDNCILNRDGQGTCPKRSPAYTWRDFRYVQLVITKDDGVRATTIAGQHAPLLCLA